jgi:hypothetical protein
MIIHTVTGRAISTRDVAETIHVTDLPNVSIHRLHDGRAFLCDDGGIANALHRPPSPAIRAKYAPAKHTEVS